jgi:hypothetical protein
MKQVERNTWNNTGGGSNIAMRNVVTVDAWNFFL